MTKNLASLLFHLVLTGNIPAEKSARDPDGYLWTRVTIILFFIEQVSFGYRYVDTLKFNFSTASFINDGKKLYIKIGKPNEHTITASVQLHP